MPSDRQASSAAYLDQEPTLSERRELLVHLRWASRVNPDSPSRRELRKLIERPEVLNYLERLVAHAEA
jgi:hypothetical protein